MNATCNCVSILHRFGFKWISISVTGRGESDVNKTNLIGFISLTYSVTVHVSLTKTIT